MSQLETNPPGSIILDSWVFENFIRVLVHKPSAKALEILKLVYKLIIVCEEN